MVKVKLIHKPKQTACYINRCVVLTVPCILSNSDWGLQINLAYIGSLIANYLIDINVHGSCGRWPCKYQEIWWTSCHRCRCHSMCTSWVLPSLWPWWLAERRAVRHTEVIRFFKLTELLFRYSNMDYIVFSAIHHCGVSWHSITLSYDIACQYFRNLWKQMNSDHFPSNSASTSEKPRFPLRSPNSILRHMKCNATPCTC